MMSKPWKRNHEDHILVNSEAASNVGPYMIEDSDSI